MSYVRKLAAQGKLRFEPDRFGTFIADRSQVEAFARERGLQIKPSGELAATVFAMFKARKPFADIVIETKQEPDVILALRERYDAGFAFGKKRDDETDEARAQREHEEQMRAMDLELERRRRGVLFSEERPTGPAVVKTDTARSVREPAARAVGDRRR